MVKGEKCLFKTGYFEVVYTKSLPGDENIIKNSNKNLNDCREFLAFCMNYLRLFCIHYTISAMCFFIPKTNSSFKV
jgi:hypothetical protein